MTRKEAEWCLTKHLQEAYPGQEFLSYTQVASKIFAAVKDLFRLRYCDFTERVLKVLKSNDVQNNAYSGDIHISKLHKPQYNTHYIKYFFDKMTHRTEKGFFV